MRRITIKSMSMEDIPTWIALSHEYDDYVSELVPALTEWYEGNEAEPAFADYMKAKINQHEAFMASEDNGKNCLGIVAFSRKHNRITYFGISQTKDFELIGSILMNHALNQLNKELSTAVTVLKSKTQHIQKERELYYKFGFICIGSGLENGVPVDKMVKPPKT